MEITLKSGLALRPCSITQQLCKQIIYYRDFRICVLIFFRSKYNLKSEALQGRFLTISYLGGVNDACCSSETGRMSDGLLRFMACQQPKAPT